MCVLVSINNVLLILTDCNAKLKKSPRLASVYNSQYPQNKGASILKCNVYPLSCHLCTEIDHLCRLLILYKVVTWGHVAV